LEPTSFFGTGEELGVFGMDDAKYLQFCTETNTTTTNQGGMICIAWIHDIFGALSYFGMVEARHCKFYAYKCCRL